MLSDDVRNKLYKELEFQLDNKMFFNAKDYYSSNTKDTEKIATTNISSSNMTYEKETHEDISYDYANTVKGMAFSNKIETSSEKNQSITDLSEEDRKIYKIVDLIAANLDETIVIPFSAKPTSLALIKKFDWKDVFFSDIGTAWGMIKNRLKLK